MNQQQIIDYLETLTDDEIIPDGSHDAPDLTESDLKKIAGHYKGGITDPLWLQIQVPGAGGMPYSRFQMLQAIKLCERDVYRRQNP